MKVLTSSCNDNFWWHNRFFTISLIESIPTCKNKCKLLALCVSKRQAQVVAESSCVISSHDIFLGSLVWDPRSFPVPQLGCRSNTAFARMGRFSSSPLPSM